MRSYHFGSLAPALAVATVFSLSACKSEPTAYAPRTPGRPNGYTDQQLTSNRYRVTFSGNSATDQQQVEDYLLLRAAQVTINAGNSWFMFDTRTTQAKTTYVSNFTGWPSWHGYGWYWHSWPRIGEYTATSQPVTRYQAYAEIILLTDEQANDEAHAINAHEILQHMSHTPTAG